MRKKEKKVGKWKTVWKNRKNIPSLVQAYPFYAAVILIALYFLRLCDDKCTVGNPTSAYGHLRLSGTGLSIFLLRGGLSERGISE